MKRALLSVSDKSGIVELGQALSERGWALLSTGGTARTLREAGLDVTNVSDVTGHPEMMDGRVKTLHPAIHAGLLARRDREDDMAALEERGYGAIDLVAVNLYPFRDAVTGSSFPVADAMEVVDIGGPTMIRAAAKSHRDVWVVVDPADYEAVIRALDGDADGPDSLEGGDPEQALRRQLAAKVFRHISSYDAAVARYLDPTDPPGRTGWQALPERLDVTYCRIQALRYGENPDQEAAFYGTGDRIRPDLSEATPRQGAFVQQSARSRRCDPQPVSLRLLSPLRGVHHQAHDAVWPRARPHTSRGIRESSHHRSDERLRLGDRHEPQDRRRDSRAHVETLHRVHHRPGLR